MALTIQANLATQSWHTADGRRFYELPEPMTVDSHTFWELAGLLQQTLASAMLAAAERTEVNPDGTSRFRG